MGGCDPGLQYDKQTCSCVSSIGSNSTVVGDRAARSTLPFPTMEHIVIMVLASIIILLLVFLVSLSVKIRRLSTRILYHQGGSPLSDVDLEVKQLNPGNVVYVEGSCSTPSSGFYSEIAANDKVYKRESDSLYHSAESVRLKKRSPEELAAEEAKAPVNIIENTLVGDDVFIRFKNFEDKPYVAYASPNMSYNTNTLRRSQPKPFPTLRTEVDNGYLHSDDVQYGTIRVSRSQQEEYGSLQRPVDLSSYKSASRHIDEALRLLQESADGL